MSELFLISAVGCEATLREHIGVGGLMSSVPTSAQDSIFYLHHANVDRLWNLWLAQGARSDPLADATWKSTKFTFFNEDAIEVQMTSCQVLRAAEQLYYAYEGSPEISALCASYVFAFFDEAEKTGASAAERGRLRLGQDE